MTTVFDASMRYVMAGYSIVPCVGKKAAVPWANLCNERPTPQQVQRWHDDGLLQNVGIIGGAVSGNLVLIDLDGDEAVSRFAAAFPGLMETYTVQSGSGHGVHLYLRSGMLPRSKRTTGLEWGNVEMRADGCYVVAPPSIHPDSGLPYTVINRVPIKQVVSLTLLSLWIDSQNATKRPERQSCEEGPAIKDTTVRTASQSRQEKWAEAALEGECAAVRSALPGSRNERLNLSAFKLGQIVAMTDKQGNALNLLSADDVVSALLSAASSLIGDEGELAALKTIRSGLNAGIENPRGEVWSIK